MIIKKKILLITVVIILVLLSATACSQSDIQLPATDVSDLSMNHLDFSKPVTDQFTFIVYGHSYGSPDLMDGLPSITLRENLGSLLEMQPDFIISLGDTVKNPTTQQFDELDSMLLSKYDVPVFNSVGNHDVMDRELYESIFGEKTYYSFEYANAAFIVLDTEIDDCYIEGEQLEMLQSSIEQALSNDAVDTIFVMMHKVLYMDTSLMKVNDSSMVRTNDLKIFSGNNFAKIIDSLLVPAALEKPVHIFAGDVGAFNGNLSPYYQKDSRADLYMYASGLGDSDNDVVLIVNNNRKNVTVTPYRLVSGQELKIEEYSPTYWEYVDREDERTDLTYLVMKFGKECVFGVCRVGKKVFNLQCRYVYLIIGSFLAGLITLLVMRIRKKRVQVKK